MKNIVVGSMMMFLLPLITLAQYFTVEDIELGLKSYLEPTTVNNLHWQGNSDRYFYSNDSLLYSVDAYTDSTSKVLDLYELNQFLLRSGMDLLSSFPEMKVLSDSKISFMAEHTLILYDILKKRAIDFNLPDTAENISINQTMQYVAYTLGNNLFVMDTSASVSQITFDSIDGIKNGDIVYRNEFGIKSGLSWSTKGNFLAWYRKDETGVSRYPLVNIDARVAAYSPVRYPMAGMKSEETDIWIYAMDTKSKVRLQISGDREQYHTNLSWLPDESAVYLQHLNRDQDTMTLKSYSTGTGILTQVLFTETDERLQPAISSIRASRMATTTCTILMHRRR